ncbi:helix-turn-helix domain-containing protein [Treponema primitia]|uniref:helix-turn-helix domain-containing protein n=1 Tax=Treponema primitia TaxID=88058 RepID=UPI0002555241|nr:helix-turn-helix transcriptional regulator [Treponema primitia]
MTEYELRKILSINLKRYRAYRKFSQADLAEKLGISIPFLSDVENGRKWVSPVTLVKFAAALNIEPYELFKPEDVLSPSIASALSKWSDEVSEAVTQTLSNIRDHYLTESNIPHKD